MNQVKDEVQSRIEKRGDASSEDVLGGAKGANEVLDKLRGGS